LQSITKQDVKDLLQGMYDKGYSLNTISNCKGILTKAFDYAVDSAYLSFSPASGIRSIKKTGRPPQTPTTTEPHVYIPQERIEQIFSRFPEGSSTHIPMMLGYHCGLRLGEAFGLVWEDVDWEHHTLAINRQVQWNPNGGQDGYWYFAEPKYQSYRIITLDDTMYDLLRREKTRQEKAVAYFGQRYAHYYIPFPLVLGGTEPPTRQVENRIGEEGKEVHFINVRENGTFISPRTMQHTSLIIHHKLDYSDFDFHSLRHTHATMLKENGAQDVYIQHRLGHAKVEVTTQVYTNHLTRKMEEDGDNLLRSIY
jgi:integrase